MGVRDAIASLSCSGAVPKLARPWQTLEERTWWQLAMVESAAAVFPGKVATATCDEYCRA